MKKLVYAIPLLILLALCAPLYHAQQPQTPTAGSPSAAAPISALNAKYANGMAPGYWVTCNSSTCASLVVNVSAGTAYCSNAIVSYAGGTLTLANNTTNYVYLDGNSSCAPASNTSGFSSTTVPVAVVVTSSGSITSLTDDRTHFKYASNAGAGSGVTVSGSPASGNLSKWSGSSSVTNGDLSGDVTTSGSLVTTVANVGGTAAATVKTRDFGTTFGDTAGSALTSGSVVYFTVPYACTISAWNISVDAGTVTFDIWKIATGTAIPTVSNTITASAKPALSTGTSIHSTTLTGWTTSVSANDIFGIQLNTVATAKFAELDIQCNQ